MISPKLGGDEIYVKWNRSRWNGEKKRKMEVLWAYQELFFTKRMIFIFQYKNQRACIFFVFKSK